ncbi:SDR family oxidoreductase [Desulfosporosinus sp. PR]|uniref:SDR family oxidoreductase n=1 Tax=Candidatus Desulfosporosinus nitrosoreducens TaxID=3401928 RepID=UPI0027F4C5C3|nr:SDR family oxidoreductase [Desulfosporosinus sp. PR]MDQ7093542.1 SDR family oxidoreductase [Desulfosporosinus sp. PR]
MKNKIALVTGGSRGLGKNIALKLALKGLDVIITYHTKKEEASQVVEEIKKSGGKAAALQLDIGDVRSFASFFEQLAKVLKLTFDADSFDYLINNAGIGMNVPFKDTTEEQFDLLLNVQFKGVYFFTQKALDYLNDGGGVINMSSRLAQASMPGYSAYASMKGAIETLTRYQAKELSSRGIRVNAVAPGPIATDFAGGIIRDNAQYNANVKAAAALGRVGEPEDIGGVVAFLCTEDARWITAQRIEVSGGMNL